jgi:hypothetical protein
MEVLFINLSLNLQSPQLLRTSGTELPSRNTSHWLISARLLCLLSSSLLEDFSYFDFFFLVLAGLTVNESA